MTVAQRTLGVTGRIAAVALYGIIAFLVADRLGESPPRPVPPIPTVGESLPNRISHLKIEVLASRPVATWRIHLEGVALQPRSASALSWSGEFAGALPIEARLVLAIEPTPTGDETPLAVRLRIEGDAAQINRTFWSDSDLVEAIPLKVFRTPEGDTP